MKKTPFWQFIATVLALAAAWLALKYALPVALPFLLGGGIALAAEPVGTLLRRRLGMPRWASSTLSVTMVILLLTGAAVALLALVLKQAGRLGAVLPELAGTVSSGLGSLEHWLLGVAEKAPTGVRHVLTDSVTGLFSDGSAVMEQAVSRGVGLASKILGAVTDGALGVATGMLAAYMISVRLPGIKNVAGKCLPTSWTQRYLPALRGLKGAAWGWLSAQLKLSAVAFGVLLAGFWILRIPHPVLWAAVIGIIDAFPILGCGTVLVPWCAVSFLQGQGSRGVGLLAIWVLTWLLRSVLEPRLLGKELGLDPLLTLIAIYAGLKLFGFVGMLLAPLLALLAVRLLQNPETLG